MTSKAYLAIDLGAESGRVIAGVFDGTRIAMHELYRFANAPLRLPTGLHWDLTGLWREIMAGTRRALAWIRERGLPLVSLGVDTWGVDYALLGESGELLGLPHAYRDERNQPFFERALDSIRRDKLYAATGIQFMALNTLYQLLAQSAAEPEMVAHARRLLFMPDLVHYYLTGNPVVEATIASTSQMLDPRTGDWAWSLLDELKLPVRMLGDIVPAGTTIGPPLPHVAAELDLDPDVRVITPASHDTASAVAAIPADPASNWCYLSSGTWSLIGAELEQPCLTDAAREAPFTNEGGVGGTIRFLKNITGLWLVQECRRYFEQRGESCDYARLSEAAAGVAAFRTLVNPDHAEFLRPGRIPEKIAAFAERSGQPAPHAAGEFIRCCLESLALAYRHALELLENVLGRRFDVIHVVGGGAKNRLLNQMTADATGKRVAAGPYEATALGNLLIQAMGTGEVRDRFQVREIVAQTATPETYEPRDTGAWQRAYERYRELSL